jgi:hypothetical protein
MSTSQQDIFKKFERSSPFSILAADWPTAVRDDFTKFVLAAHDSGLDLWIIADGQIRLGNKSGTRIRAEACVAWIIVQKNGPVISFSRLVAGTDTPWEIVGKAALTRMMAPGFLKTYPVKSRVVKWPNEYSLDHESLPDEAQAVAAAMTIDLGEVALTDTERDALIKARIGQSRYRDSLLAYWRGCSVTECSIPQLLRASHIKPWHSANHAERLDQFNGLLLTPNLDLAFDKGLISFDDHGEILLSPKIDAATAAALHLSPALRLRQIEPRHRSYLKWHREELFGK